MTRLLTFAPACALTALLFAPTLCPAQTQPPLTQAGALPEAQTQTEPLDELVGRLANTILTKKKKTVIVLDLEGPDEEYATLGTLLADHVSEALIMSPTLKAIDRLEIPGALWRLKLSEQKLREWGNVRKLCKRLGAKVAVRGTFARSQTTLTIRLTASAVFEQEQGVGTATGTIALTQEMVSLLPERMNSLRVFRSGKDGVGYPKCTSCPNPEYPDDARAQKLQGRVLLLVTITPEGRTTNIVVLRRAGHGLDERAIEAVRKWRFNPAPGPDGKPVPVRTPIEVTFRLL